MSYLISENELKQICADLNIEEYYIERDMNGALSLFLTEEDSYRIEELEDTIKDKDIYRTSENIYNIGEAFYPLKKIDIDDYDYEETKEKFKNNSFIKSKYTQQLNSWSIPPIDKNIDNKSSRVKRVAFYSYKGGVGRTTSLAIVSRLLAKQGFKVAVIDLDLEAPGLNSLLLTKKRISPFGVVDYLYQAPWIRDNIDQKRFLSQYIIREDVPRGNEKSGQIILMPSGGTNIDKDFSNMNSLIGSNVKVTLEQNYLQKLSYINFDLYTRQSQNIFADLLEDIEKFTNPDIILIDVRTGFSDISGAVLNQFSDILSVNVQDNKQNIEGMRFIFQHINGDKLKNNTIWSYTKAPKNYNPEFGQLKSTIAKYMCEPNENSIEIQCPNLNYLNYDSNLEDIDATQLAEYIESDKISISYKNLAEQISKMARIDEKLLLTYISENDRISIINDINNLIDNNIESEYISKRFLSDDIDLFVGFPGSGKRTFKKYMNEKYKKQVNVMDIKDFLNTANSSYKLLTDTIFLDWTQHEASQAICKWLLQSEFFYNWLLNNRNFSNKLSNNELKKMRTIPEYELSDESTEFILNLIFGDWSDIISSFDFIFTLLTYKNTPKKLTLPKDIIQGVKLFIKLCIEKDLALKDGDFKALFNMKTGIILNLNLVIKTIGKEKKDWIKNFNEKIYLLITIFITNQNELKLLYNTKDYTIEDAKKILLDIFMKDSNFTEKDFENTLNESLNLNIFELANIGGFQRLQLMQVYNLI